MVLSRVNDCFIINLETGARVKSYILFLAIIFLAACQNPEPWHDPYPREIRTLMNYYVENDYCDFNLSDAELQQRIEWLASGTDVEKYRAGQELIFSADKSVPVIMRNIDRPELANARFIKQDYFKENSERETIPDPLIHILEVMASIDFKELNDKTISTEVMRRREVQQWKEWYEISKDNLGCNPMFGLTHPFVKIVKTELTEEEFNRSVSELLSAS